MQLYKEHVSVITNVLKQIFERTFCACAKRSPVLMIHAVIYMQYNNVLRFCKALSCHVTYRRQK